MTPQPPSPNEVEARAREYHRLAAEINAITQKAANDLLPLQNQLDTLKLWFLEHVRQFGSSHSEKSKILHGTDFEATVTFGQSNTIDGAAVETFRLALVKADKPHLLKRLFEKTIRWTLAADASAFIREHEDKLGAKLLALYSRCSVTKECAPRLTVRPKQNSAIRSQQSA